MPITKHEYNWPRFWYPRQIASELSGSGSPDLSDGGYLRDPEHLIFPYYASNVVTWDQIKDTPCLVFLGEPGSGKSHALRKMVETTELDSETLSYFADLGECPLESLGDQILVNWLSGDQDLTLFLDSLDEGIALVPTLLGYLAKRLRAWPSKRFRLRIACRAESWPLSLEKTLEEIFGPSRVKVYQLAPLRRVDILQAAKENGFDCDRFIDEIDRCNAVSLAIRPITLELLLRIYDSRQGQLTSNMIKLYEDGCKYLCREPSQRQRDLGLGTASEDDCMTVAGYIAAQLILTGNGSLWTDSATDDIPEGCITISRIIGTTDQVECPDPLVSYDSVQKIRKTSLFASRGPNCVAFAHQTYAEFLAARYLHRHLSSRQITNLISCTDRYGEAIIPQLRSITSWLASLMPEIWEYVFRVEPLLLIDSDMLSKTDSDRDRLVSALLEQHQKNLTWEIRARYPNLAHPGLADQLRPYVNTREMPFRVRREALLLVKACQVRELQDDLVSRALDKTENDDIRWLATWALDQIGDVSTKSRLKPLALGQDPTDQNENVRGWALRATWHVCITSEELFATITPPQSEGQLLAYQWFIEFELAPSLTSSDLLPALEWVQRVTCQSQVPHSLHVLADTIILMAWNHMEEPAILNLMARIIVTRAALYIDFSRVEARNEFVNLEEADVQSRRALIEAVIAAVSLPDADLRTLARDLGPNLVTKGRDLDWFLEQACAHSGTAEAQRWAIVAFDALDRNDQAQLSRTYQAKLNCPELADEFIPIFGPILFGSPLAEAQRQCHERSQRSFTTVVSTQQPAEPVTQWLESALAQIDAGSDETWVELAFALERFRITGQTVDDSLQARATAASVAFVHRAPAVFTSLGVLSCPMMIRAVIFLLRQISNQSPAELDSISQEQWRVLVPVIFANRNFGPGDEELYAALLPRAYQHAQPECTEALKRQISLFNNEPHAPDVLEMLDNIWDNHLEQVLLAELRCRDLGPQNAAKILVLLLKQHQPEALDVAFSLLEAPGSMQPSSHARSCAIAGILLYHADEPSWTRLWRILGSDPDFFLKVISACAVSSKGEEKLYSLAERLSTTQICELCIWLFHWFPNAEDAIKPGDELPGAQIFYWRESLLRYLMQSGTWEACAAIEHIKMEILELERLSIILDQAIVSARQMAWKPPQPADIIQLLSRKSTRFVQDDMQLLEVVIESLEKLESKLHDEIPAVRFLWNEDKNRHQRPKEEAPLSDYVTLHLRELVDRGVVVNREVQIHRGERTDIHIDTVIEDQDGQTHDRISLIIEVKGCWNRDLEIAMEEQLLNHYLKDNACRCGIYLIGWFKCDQWDKEDYRKGDTPTYELEEARQRFSSQAEALSGEVTIRAVMLDTSLR